MDRYALAIDVMQKVVDREKPFSMEYFVGNGSPSGKDYDEQDYLPPCNSPACAVGHLVLDERARETGLKFIVVTPFKISGYRGDLWILPAYDGKDGFDAIYTWLEGRFSQMDIQMLFGGDTPRTAQEQLKLMKLADLDIEAARGYAEKLEEKYHRQ